MGVFEHKDAQDNSDRVKSLVNQKAAQNKDRTKQDGGEQDDMDQYCDDLMTDLE